MNPFYVVREYTKSDSSACQSLVQSYIMSFENEAFVSCFFREITLQLVVLVWAFLFIFLGCPLLICFGSIPGVLLLMYLAIKTSLYNKSNEATNIRFEQCWLIEAYEPYLMRTAPENTSYTWVDLKDLPDVLRDPAVRTFRKVLVGTVSQQRHHTRNNSGWLSRWAILPNYSRNEMTEHLIETVLDYSEKRGYDSVETVTTECQFGIRDKMMKYGFDMKQIYHQKVFANVSIMKSQLSIELQNSRTGTPLQKVVTHL